MTDHAVTVSDVIPAPIDAVFDAWLIPEIRQKWWRPSGADQRCTRCEIDAREGGDFAVGSTHAQKPGGCSNTGTFIEISRPVKLVFTWSSDDPEDNVVDSHVTVSFRAVDRSRTEVTILHERLPNRFQMIGHRDGWCRLVETLSAVLASSEFNKTPAAT